MSAVFLLSFTISGLGSADLGDLYSAGNLIYFLTTSLAVSTLGIVHYHVAYPHFMSRKKYVGYAAACIALYCVSSAICFAGYLLQPHSAGLTTEKVWTALGRISWFMAFFGLPFAILYASIQASQKAAGKRREIEHESRRTSILLLQKKLEPHFLFNSLNAIYTIAQQEEADATVLAVDRLSEELREKLAGTKPFPPAATKEKNQFLPQLFVVWLGINGFTLCFEVWEYFSSGIWTETAVRLWIYQPALLLLVSFTITAHYYWLYKPCLMAGRYARYFVLLLPFVAAMVLIDCFANYTLVHLLPSFKDEEDSIHHFMMIAVARVLTAEAVCAWIYAAVSHYRHSRRLRDEALKQQLDGELKLRQSQADTDRLFHSLQTLDAAAATDNAPGTIQAVNELTSLFRYSAAHAGDITVPVAEELRFLEQYMRVRQDAGVRITTAIATDGSAVEIAPMLLLPFIENAFKYGISYALPSFIDVKIAIKQGMLHCHIANTDHARLRRSASSAGLGMADTARRLDLQYAGRYTLAHGSSEGIHRVHLTVHLQ